MTVERIQASPIPLPEHTLERSSRERSAQCTSQLRWVKPSLFGNQYELQSSERRLGTLRIQGLFRPKANGEAIEGCWTFEPIGSGATKLAVRTTHSLNETAVFDMSFSDHGGMLRFSDGRALILKSYFYKRCAEFQAISGDPLIRFHFHGILRPSAEVEILGEGRQLSELTWILMLGWCLIVGYL